MRSLIAKFQPFHFEIEEGERSNEQTCARGGFSIFQQTKVQIHLIFSSIGAMELIGTFTGQN